MVIAFTALLLVALAVITAIVLDIGNGRQTKRRVQNAVDAAALAASVEYDGSTSTTNAAISEGVDYLGVNSITASGTGANRSCAGGETCTIRFTFCNIVTPSTTCAAPTATVPAAAAGTRLCVTVEVEDLAIDTSFASVIGRDELRVGAAASGCKRFSASVGSVPAAHALGNCATTGSPAYESFEVSGTDSRFEGGLHSNGSARDTGTNNLRHPSSAAWPATVKVNIADVADRDQLWNPFSVEAGPARPDPVVQALGVSSPQGVADLYAPTGARAIEAKAISSVLYNGGSATLHNNDITLSGNIPAGIYYTTKKLVVTGTGTTVTPRIIGGTTYTGVILVATGGEVDIAANGARLTPFSVSNGLRLTVVAGWDSTGSPCSDQGFKISGECSRVDGVMYVPFTKATFSNNGNGHDDNGRSGTNCTNTPAYTGGLVSYSMKLDGNQHWLRGGTGGPSSSTPEYYLDSLS